MVNGNAFMVGMESRLKELISGKQPANLHEKLFIKGFSDAKRDRTLLTAYLEIGDTEDLEELDRKFFILGFSVGLEMLNSLDKMRLGETSDA